MASPVRQIGGAVGLAALLVFVLAAMTDGQQEVNVSESCLACICEAVSGCNQTLRCEGDVCGVFRITRGYWIDAGKISLAQDNTDGYTACTLDPYCAGQVVRAYMSRFAQDCNNDGLVNCDDYATIHRLGGFDCHGTLDQRFKREYLTCKQLTEADCNRDGIVNCDDFAAIHLLGGYGCYGPLNQRYLNTYTSCKQQTQVVGGNFE